MERIRKYALVVCLSAAMALSADAAGTRAAEQRHKGFGERIIARILSFFNTPLQSRVSTPPG